MDELPDELNNLTRSYLRIENIQKVQGITQSREIAIKKLFAPTMMWERNLKRKIENEYHVA